MTHGRSQTKPTSGAPPTVSWRWLLAAVAIAISAAGFIAWAVLCLLFWQGSWQLLYHPTAAVTRTPANVGLAFDPVGFAASDTGVPRLAGWWIPANAQARSTVLYLHGQDGNLGDTVDALLHLHNAGVNVLAFDYRGYGASQFVRPSEASWREDAAWGLQYLTATRHVDPHSIVLAGSGLGANLALEVAASHPELAGVVLESPLDAPVKAIFADPRARLVPARLLVRDHFEMNAPASALRIPSLWFYGTWAPGILRLQPKPEPFQRVTSTKNLVWLTPNRDRDADFSRALSRWLSSLPNPGSSLPLCQYGDGFVC